MRKVKLIRLIALMASVSVLAASLGFAPAQEVHAENGVVNIVLDPGHGGTDQGATSVGGLEFQEKNLTFKLAQYIQYELRKYKGVSVNLTRYADYHMTSVERAEYAQRVGADIVVSLHFNSSSDRMVHGASVCASGLWEYTSLIWGSVFYLSSQVWGLTPRPEFIQRHRERAICGGTVSVWRIFRR